MKIDAEKHEIQLQAYEAWKKAGRVGTMEAITGIGKTMISLHAMSDLPAGAKVLHLAETTLRPEEFKKDMKLYKQFWEIDLNGRYDIEFACYQSAYKWSERHFNLVIADEIHDGMTPVYSKFFKNNSYDQIIGLSATVDRNVSYENGQGQLFTKGQVIDHYCPVVFNYDLKKGHSDGTARPLNVTCIFNRLNSVTKDVVVKTKSVEFMSTEQSNYEYWSKRIKQAQFMRQKFLVSKFSGYRSRMLYNLKSKDKIVKRLLHEFEMRGEKTILFANSLDALYRLLPYSTISSRNKNKNDQILKDFNDNKILSIGSFKMLKQGVNLKGLDNCILHSYYSSSKDLIQRIGRLRKDGDKLGNIYIIVTMGTKEQDWFSKMTGGKGLKINYFNNINEYYDQKN